MTASDWWLFVLTCTAVAGAALGLGYLWGMWRGIGIADDTIDEMHKRIEALSAEATGLRNDLARQLNKQFEL